MAAVILPPSPNWYGSHLSDATPSLYAFCAHNSIVLLDTPSLTVVDILKGHRNRTTAVAFAHGGRRIVSAASDKSLRVWSCEGTARGQFVCCRALGKRPAEVKAIASVSEDTVFLGDAAGNVFTWNAANPAEKVRRLEGCKDRYGVTCAASSPGTEPLVAVGYAAGVVRIINWQLGTVIYTFCIHDAKADIHCVAWTRLNIFSETGKGPIGAVDMLVSTSSAGDAAVYATTYSSSTEAAEQMGSSEMQLEGGVNIAAELTCMLQVPGPTGSMGRGQKTRLWVPAAWPPAPVVVQDDAPAAWLLMGGYGGAVHAWKVPITTAKDGALIDSVGPFRLPGGHSRTVFSMHCFLDPVGKPPEFNPGLLILTAGMDRAVLGSWVQLPTLPLLVPPDPSVPHPPAAALEMSMAQEGQAWQEAVPAGACYGLGAHPQCVAPRMGTARVSLDPIPKIAVGCGDATIRVLTFQKTLSEGSATQQLGGMAAITDLQGCCRVVENVLLWQGIPAAVAAVTFHPLEDDIVVFGCIDGTIGLAHSKKGTCILAPGKHSAPVAKLAWVEAPPLEDEWDASSGSEDAYEEGDCCLLSLSSDGVLLRWRIWRNLEPLFPAAHRYVTQGAGTPAAPVCKKLGKPENVGAELLLDGIVPTALAEVPSSSLLAIGTADGNVAIAGPGAILEHIVQCHPLQSPVARAALVPPMHAVLLHEDGTLSVTSPNAERFRGTPTCSSTKLPEAAQPTALAAVSGVTAGYPELRAVVAIGMQDGSIQIWFAENSAAPFLVGALGGHGGAVLSLEWIKAIKVETDGLRPASRLLISSSEDQSLRLWDVASQLDAVKEGKAQGEEGHAESTGEPLLGGAERAAMEDSGPGGEEEVPPPPPPPSPPSQGITPVEQTPETVHSAEEAVPAPEPTAEGEDSVGGRAEPDQAAPAGHTKKGGKDVTFGSKSLLPPAPPKADDVLEQEARQAAVLRLAQGDADTHPSLECPRDPLAAINALEIAEKSLLDKDGFHKQPQQQRRLLAQRAAAVALWSGDVGRAIHILIEHDALTADFVSFAAAAGRQAWEAVVRVYTSRLEEAGEPHLAALHLLSVGDPSAACKAYARRGMAREAALLAAAHLPPNDPQLRSLRAAYAAKLEAKGDFERAAAQYVAAHEGAKAAAALRARGSPSAVQAAAELERLLSLEVKDVGESLAAFTLAQVSPVHLDESGGMAHAAASVRKRYDPAELVAMREGPRIEMPHALQQALSTGGAASGLNPT